MQHQSACDTARDQRGDSDAAECFCGRYVHHWPAFPLGIISRVWIQRRH
jgi:hypothetical protein